ncbi:GspH/FimT family pseudopilin [Marilutibacter alkalisoli]|uniref:Type II secretion system protein H n=1 Tax=Marilutibacter alkalisoli TaxID=2591633 RepID=A0A514BPW5_9GAMM|nr:Tfp pilus assembly protein FimT/FimU [Lysobacter alkalisoli]QDH69432.1 prepilin-type N-terminal cleavage/methylation domain-containing protein [Lysobacter alkalisoli]
MRRNADGFTLVELVATVAVLAILLSLATPAFGRIAEHSRKTSALHRLTSSLALARISAVRLGIPITACPSHDGRSCRGDSDWSEGWIVYADPQRTSSPLDDSKVLEASDGLGSGIAVLGTVGRQRLRFSPHGWSAGYNQTVRLCSSDGRLLARLIVNNAGRTRTETPPEGTPCSV